MERTQSVDGALYLGEQEFSNLIGNMVRGYKFINKGSEPVEIVIPMLKEVKGVKVRYEPKATVEPRLPKAN
jgi:hypothetical protein